jgi:hypothetical protein
MQNQPVEKAYKITCPACKTKQTGYLKYANQWVTALDQSIILQPGTPYILCQFKNCGHLIKNDELMQVTTEVIRYPSDLRILRTNF